MKKILRLLLFFFLMAPFYSAIYSQASNPPCNLYSPLVDPGYNVTATAELSGIGVGSITGTANLVNSNLDDFARIALNVALNASATISVKEATQDFPAGFFAGFEISNTDLLSAGFLDNLRVETWLGDVFSESAAAGDLIDAALLSNTGRQILGFRTTQPFDEIRLVFTQALGASLGTTDVFYAVIKNYCAGDAPACNSPTYLTTPAYPVQIQNQRTGITGLASLGSISNTQNVVNANTSDFATINLTAGALTTASVAVWDVLDSYNAGTYAAVDVSFPALADINLLSGVTLSTYNNGTLQESTSDAGLVSLGTSLVDGRQKQTIGFLTTEPYDEIVIRLSNAATANIGETRVYAASVTAFCHGEPISCGQLVQLTAPDYPLFINGRTTGAGGTGCIGCGINNPDRIINNDNSDYATIEMTAGVLATSSVGISDALTTYPAGSFAGFDIQFLNLATTDAWGSLNIHLYNNGTLVQSGDGLNLLAGVTTDLIAGAYQRQVVGIISNTDFDEIQLSVNQLAGATLGELRIYGLYIEADLTAVPGNTCVVPCDFSSILNAESWNVGEGAVVNSAHTGIAGIAGVNTKVLNAWNAVSPDPGDYATLYNTGDAATRSSLSVATPSLVFPAGTHTGFVIDKNPFVVGAALLPAITLNTYLNGELQESATESRLLDLTLAFQWAGTPTTPYSVGFQTTKPFDEVQISVANLASVADQYVRVYGAFADVSGSYIVDEEGQQVPYACIVLPVDLVSFTGTMKDCKAQLEWKTAGEENFSHFEIEQAHSNGNFHTVRRIDAKGPNSLYRPAAVDARPGLNLFRIKSVDRDGRSTYSNVVMLNNGCNSEKIRISPTLTQSVSQVYGLSNGQLMRVYDSGGRMILSAKVSGFQYAIDLSNQPAGLYMVIVEEGNQKIFTGKIIRP